ncbi:hypothetical protein Tsubulata_049521 [Turnera subulata]|uniref:AB hydrolase-1 domain-containing protein n=1 Tax=Turnera subulata TaxID=218843 RepID=A0A9Q0J9Z2_9ROSI|nr:hypothetical protein Tsubulata_049521 [Turnera subulata]
MRLSLTAPPPPKPKTHKHTFTVSCCAFPSFLPKQVQNIKDSNARKLATRIERLPVSLGEEEGCIMSSCVRPLAQSNTSPPLLLLHGFDSSCLEWRYTLPLLEEAGLEPWAFDILGWGFSDLAGETLPPCDVASKRRHLYQFWKSYIQRPVILVGPSLGAAVAIDFAVTHPEAVQKLVLIDASVYAQGTGDLAKLPRAAAYAGIYLLKSVPLRLYVNVVAFKGLPLSTSVDWMNVGRLHCLYPWWEDASVNFMISGGYDVRAQIEKVLSNEFGKNKMTLHSIPERFAFCASNNGKLHVNPQEFQQHKSMGTNIVGYENLAVKVNELSEVSVQQRTLIIWGEDDQIISSKMAVVSVSSSHTATRLHCELPNAMVRQIPNCGHLPHVEQPKTVARLLMEFVREACPQEVQCVSRV